MSTQADEQGRVVLVSLVQTGITHTMAMSYHQWSITHILVLKASQIWNGTTMSSILWNKSNTALRFVSRNPNMCPKGVKTQVYQTVWSRPQINVQITWPWPPVGRFSHDLIIVGTLCTRNSCFSLSFCSETTVNGHCFFVDKYTPHPNSSLWMRAWNNDVHLVFSKQN